jgi:endo-1,4-beta-xylanase
MKNIILLTIISAVLCFPGCNPEQSHSLSLSEKYSEYFAIGAAISHGHLSDYDTVLLKKHFNSITAENDMKPERTINEQAEYSFERGDRLIEFAEENNMLVRGHTLVWHQQTDEWFFRDDEGNLLGKDEMLRRLETYINNVLDHYRGKIYAWDAVNEAISDNPEEFFKENTDWFRTCGPEYVENAFAFAKAADPEIKLFYNDYNLIDPEKAQKVYKLVKDFQARGIPVDGIGMQGHWTLEDVNTENLGNSIDLFGSLGMEVHITELDLSIYPFYHNTDRDSLSKEVKEFTEELELKQAEKYAEIFEVLREKSGIVTSVTFWGVADNKTWLSNYFVRGRTDHPLLFDANYEPKKAFEMIMDF